MQYIDDPNFVLNNFGTLRDSRTGLSPSVQITEIPSSEKVKRSGFVTSSSYIVKPDESPVSQEKLMLLVEENNRMKVLVEQLIVKLKQLDSEKSALGSPRVIFEKNALGEKRIKELEMEVEELRRQQKINEIRLVEKNFEVPVIQEKIIIDDRKLIFLEQESTKLQEEIKYMRGSIEEWRRKVEILEGEKGAMMRKIKESEEELIISRRESQLLLELKKKLYVLENQPPQIIEKPVFQEVIREKVITDDKRIKELEQEVGSLRSKLIFIESQKQRVEVPIERIIEKPVEIIKYIEKPVERIIEKIVEVPIEKIQYIERPPIERIIEKRVEVPIEKIQYIDRPIERIIEKKVEIPVEKIQYIDKPYPVEKIVERIVERKVEVPIEKIIVDDRKIRELEMLFRDLRNENDQLKGTLDEWRNKLISLEQEKLHSERVKRSVNQDKSNMESELQSLRRELEALKSRGPEVVEKIVEKIIEKPVPFEVIKERVVVDERAIRELREKWVLCNEELKRFMMMNEELMKKIYVLENQPPMILEKRVEVPIEILKETIIMGDDKVFRELEQEVTFQKAENRKMKVVIDEWKSKVADLELHISREKFVEKKVEIPVIKEKIMIDESKTNILEKRLFDLTQENISLKETLEEMNYKIVRYEEEKVGYELLKKNSINYENEIILLKKEIERLVTLVAPPASQSTQMINLVSKIVDQQTDLDQKSGGDLPNNQERIEGSKKSVNRGGTFQNYNNMNDRPAFIDEPNRNVNKGAKFENIYYYENAASKDFLGSGMNSDSLRGYETKFQRPGEENEGYAGNEGFFPKTEERIENQKNYPEDHKKAVHFQ